MASDWTPTTVGSFCPFTYGKGLPEKKRNTNGNIKVYGSNGPVGVHDQPLVDEPGIVIGRKGTVGAVHFAPEPFWPIDTTFYVVAEADRDLGFTYYLLKSIGLEYMNADSAVPGLNRDAAHARQILVPEHPEQKAIAHILGSLDDKIELNRRMNETLEAMARAIFKSWFIDFDPVIDNALRAGNPIPERFAERVEMRRQMLDQDQPSSPGPFSQGEKGGQYRGKYDFSGLLDTTRELRKNQTTAENLFWGIVRNRRFLGLKFRRQHQAGDYVVDFYCHEHRLVIELDGGIHNKKLKKDAKRDAYMESLGFTVLRFSNSQVFEDIEGVLAQIAACISPSPSGRGGGEGSMDEIHRLFPDSFQDSDLGEIPKGWKIKTIGEVVEFAYGKALKASNRKPGNVPVFGSNGPVGLHNEALVKGPGIVIGRKGNPGIVTWSSKDFFPIDTTFYVKQTESITSLNYLFYALKDQDLPSLSADSAVPGLNRNLAYMNNILVPFDKALSAFDEQIRPLFKKIDANDDESVTLAALRDTLLPKLISGKLRVPDAEKFVEEAGV